jgi:hypothetical protein
MTRNWSFPGAIAVVDVAMDSHMRPVQLIMEANAQNPHLITPRHPSVRSPLSATGDRPTEKVTL